jgi:prepilin-type N-terminal cleavage/methylation domain-containing protein
VRFLKKGFTYIEVMIAVAIFSIMMIFIIRLDTVTSRNVRNFNENMKMMNIAQSEIEVYKSKPEDSSGKIVEGYFVMVKSISLDAYLSEVTVTVKKSAQAPDSEALVLKNHLLKK